MKLDLYFLSLSSSFFIRTVKGGWHNGAYGENVECPGGQVMVGACSSPVRNWCVKAEGKGHTSHTIRCEPLDGNRFGNVSNEM